MSRETKTQSKSTVQDTDQNNKTAKEEGLFPVEPKWFTIGFYLFLLLWVGYILSEAMTYAEFEDYLFPYIWGIPVVLLIIIRLFMMGFPEVVQRIQPGKDVADTEGTQMIEEQVKESEAHRQRSSKREQEKYELYMLAWVTILPFMMFFLGMGWTIPIYLFTFTLFFTRNIKLSAGMTLLVAVFVYILFIQILDMIVWSGILGLPDPIQYLPSLPLIM